MTHHFSIQEAIRFGWHKTREHSGVVFPIVLTLLGIQVASAIVDTVLKDTALGLFATLVLWAASVVLGIGATRVALRIAGGHTVQYRDIMPPTKLLWPYIAASILTGLAVIGGLILLIIPGIWLALRLSMVRFEIIEGAGIKESLHKSYEITRGHALKLLALLLVLGLINILGAIALMVGLLVTMPLSAIAFAHVYLRLKHKP